MNYDPGSDTIHQSPVNYRTETYDLTKGTKQTIDNDAAINATTNWTQRIDNQQPLDKNPQGGTTQALTTTYASVDSPTPQAGRTTQGQIIQSLNAKETPVETRKLTN